MTNTPYEDARHLCKSCWLQNAFYLVFIPLTLFLHRFGFKVLNLLQPAKSILTKVGADSTANILVVCATGAIAGTVVAVAAPAAEENCLPV